MKISGWHINGFGIFADYRIDDLSPGLTVVHGPNEAGKSALVAFVMSVLFGFADGRSKGPRYAPLFGGEHGGRLLLQTDDGDYTVERTKKGRSPIVTRPSGTAGGDTDLRDLLGGADRRLFGNIFAFSLHELQEFDTLQDDAVRERIFATPTFGGGQSPGDVSKALQGRQTGLLRPRAASTIGDLIRGLQDADSELRRARAESKAYPRAVSDLDDAARAVDRLTNELNEASSEASRYQKLVDVWPDWSARSAASSELSKVATPEGVTLAIEGRLNEARQQIERIQVKVDERQKELKRPQSRLSRIVVDDSLPPVAKEAKTLYSGAAAYDTDLKRLTEMDVQIEHQQAGLSKAITDLGPEWNQERVEQFDASIPTADEVRTRGDQMRTIDAGIERHTTQIADLSERLREATEDCTRAEEGLEDYPDTPQLDTIESTDMAARRLRGLLSDVAPARERADSDAQRLEDRQRDLDKARSAKVLGVPPGVLLGLPILLVVGAVVAGILGEIAVAVVLGLLTIGFVIGFLMPGRLNKDRLTVAAEDDVREAEEAADARRREYDTIEEQVLEEAAKLGFDGIPSNAAIEENLGEIARHRADRTKVDALANRLQEERTKKQSLQETLEKSRLSQESLQSEREDQQQQWDTW